jgi:UDP-glucose 4-epimerase
MQLIRESLKYIDAVFHLAGIVSVPYSVENPKITNNVNVGGIRNLLEASASNGVGRFVNVSSCAVYGDPQYIPIDEDHPVNPMSPYAQSKLVAEKLCQEFLEKRGLKTVSLRLFNVYGPRQRANEYSGVIIRFISDIRKGKPPVIFGDGQQTRDFVHVSDVVQAFLLAANSNCSVGETFNIGSGKAVTIDRLSRLLLIKLKADIEPVYKEPRAGDVKHSCAKIDKAHRMLGYEPKVSFEKGLGDLIKHWSREFRRR